MDKAYTYVIVGAGLAGASAVEGIRDIDRDGSILLIGSEKHLPYHRPPLTKKLWFGQKQVEDIFVHDAAFYSDNGVDVVLDSQVVDVDAKQKMVEDSNANIYPYESLLLATGGTPKRLQIAGGDMEGVCYYRTLDSYLATRSDASDRSSALVIGGGYIGSEIAAALNANEVNVTMVFPEFWLTSRVFPEGLGREITRQYEERGITIHANDVPVSVVYASGTFTTTTREGRVVQSDIVIAGIGISPSTELAESAGLKVDDGIVVDEFLCTSNPDIYAAGDNARFPYAALGENRRIEHWDHALNSGRQAGRNMAGANEPYTYMPYFFSDLFDFGYEAVGDVNPELDVIEDWQKEYDTGVIYFLKDSKVRGAMMCNVWDKVPAARELIIGGQQVTADELRGAIA